MVCPQCGSAYRPEMTVCPDCRINLIESFPPDKVEATSPEIAYRLAISTSNFGDIALIKSLFTAEDIPFFVEGENFNLISPWIQPVRFFVREDHFADAREVLHNFEAHHIGPSINDAENE